MDSNYLLQLVSENILDLRISVAADALLMYEYLITLGDEIDVVWSRPWTGASVLLLSTRWTMLLSAAVDLAPGSSTACGAMEIVVAAATLLGDLQVAIFSALRVYAIANRNLYFTGSVLLLGLVPIATNLYATVLTQPGYAGWPFFVCSGSSSISDHDGDIFRLATRASAVAMDILVLGITWTRTFRQWQEARDLKIASPVTTCLLRDGTWYFITLLLLNILQMTLPNESVFASTFVSALLVTLPPILVNRFMINLRSTSSPQSASFEASRIVSQAIFLGNIGEPLARDGEEDGQQRKKRRAASDSMEIASDEEGKQWSASKSGEC